MAVVLICSDRPLERYLKATILFRSGIEREMFRSAAEVQSRLAAGDVALLGLHREVPGAEGLIKALRKSPSLKRVSIVVFSEDDFDPSDLELLEAGANAILRLPPADDFNERLSQLMEVPARRDVRIPVRLQVAASGDFGVAIPALAQNLSASGILIETYNALNMGDEVSVALRFEAGEIFSAVALIARTAGPNRYGARFTSITQGEEGLKAFLASSSVA